MQTDLEKISNEEMNLYSHSVNSVVNNLINVDKNDEFFISIGEEGMHSFVMLGVMQQDGTPTLLARVGKGVIDCINLTFFKSMKILFNSLFSHNDAKLYSEYLSSTTQREISYAAYAINYNQYLQFIKFISGFVNVDLKSSHEIYQPIPNTETDTTITLQKSHLDRTLNNIKINQNEQHIIEKSKNLHIGNTCRNTAIDLIEYTQGSKLTDNVSSIFFKDLPLTTTFLNGKPKDYFYVFPAPPGAYKQIDKEKKALLTTIYKRMENLLTKDHYSAETIGKFKALKTLYNEQVNMAANNWSIEKVLQSIAKWKSDNHHVISVLRKQSFLSKLFGFNTSSTVAMVDEIQQALKKHRKN